MLSEVQQFTLNVVGTYFLKKIKRLCIRVPYNFKDDKLSDKIVCGNKRCLKLSCMYDKFCNDVIFAFLQFFFL